ncbi:hypothetical protein XPA_010123 [Xanthoria parietina]
MGGFLAPDPTNGFTNCMHAFAFIRPTPKETAGPQKSKLRFRRQNPVPATPDVVPTRPLTPAADLGRPGTPLAQIPISRHTSPLTRSYGERRKLCKKRAVKKTLESTPLPKTFRKHSAPENDHPITPPHLPPRPQINIDPEQHSVPDNTEVVTAAAAVVVSSVTKLDLNPFDDEHSLLEGGDTNQNDAGTFHALSALRPRLPHQRMQYLRRLGDGGEGHIDLFRLHRAPQTLLAVKTLRRTPELISHKSNKRKPLEAHILQDLLPTAHPHIVQMFGYTCTPRKTILIYEYCSLGDLQDLLENYFARSASIPEGFIWHVYLAIAKALAYMHTGYIAQSSSPDPSIQGTDDWTLQMYNKPWTPILHRDLKPENIFFRPSTSSPYPTPLLADFGLATSQTPNPYQCFGTYTYQGPEIPTQTTASDLWSLGATIHALVHGRPPMIPKPNSRSTESWEFDPRSRRVKEVSERGYSLQLGIVMKGVLRRRMEERLAGKRLVQMVELGRKEWGGVEEGMQEWAFDKLEEGKEEDDEWDVSVRGCAEKPWKRG